MNYNLLEEEWIPVLYRDGRFRRVNVLDALTEADHIREIAASNPMDRLAILRFFLALLYWCQGNPPEDPLRPFPSDWFDKLREHSDCFNLLGDGKRFCQCRPDCGKGKKLSANYLIQEVPTGTNSWHFRHSTDGVDGLCEACCAMGLLRLPPFATSGGRGKPPGVNQKPPVYVVPVGASLVETLCLSWRKIPDGDLGKPNWETPSLSLPDHGNVPLLNGLTWAPRRVRLDDPGPPEANCISCGRKTLLIRQCVFAGVGGTQRDSAGKGPTWRDPHTITDGANVVKPGDSLDATDAAAGNWTKIVAAILDGKIENPKGDLRAVSFATVQNDKYLEAVEQEISSLKAVDGEERHEGAELVERWQREGRKLVRKASPKEASRKYVEIASVIGAARAHVESRVFANLGEFVAGGEDAWERVACEYTSMMTAVAQSLAPGYTTASLERRRLIARVKPSMRSTAGTHRKSVTNEGGSK